MINEHSIYSVSLAFIKEPKTKMSPAWLIHHIYDWQGFMAAVAEKHRPRWMDGQTANRQHYLPADTFYRQPLLVNAVVFRPPCLANAEPHILRETTSLSLSHTHTDTRPYSRYLQ